MQQRQILFKALFDSFDPQRPGWSLALGSPIAVYTAAHLDQVPAVVQEAEGAAAQGRWAAVLLAYESAPAFDSALAAHPGDESPLAVVAVYDAAESMPANSPPRRVSRSAPAAV